MRRLLNTLLFVALAVPVAAQAQHPAQTQPAHGDGGGGGGGGHARSGPSGGGSAPSAPRGGSSSGGGSGASSAPRSGGGSPSTGAGARATGRSDPGRSADSGGSSGSAAPRHGRQRDPDAPVTGAAVPRGSVPPTGGGTVVVTHGAPLYPWWFGGVGAGYYGGYYGGYYDPWFGGYYDDPPPVVTGRYGDEGKLRLKIKPREAEVYVDGYYVGIVDEFDGVFQRLTIESGPHHVEVRAAGFQPLTFDVQITPDHVTTYTGELTKVQ